MARSNVHVLSTCAPGWIPPGVRGSEFQSSLLALGQCFPILCSSKLVVFSRWWLGSTGYQKLSSPQCSCLTLSLPSSSPASCCAQKPLTRCGWAPPGALFYQALGERQKEQRNRWPPFLWTPLLPRMAKNSRGVVIQNCTGQAACRMLQRWLEHGSQSKVMSTQPTVASRWG